MNTLRIYKFRYDIEGIKEISLPRGRSINAIYIVGVDKENIKDLALMANGQPTYDFRDYNRALMWFKLMGMTCDDVNKIYPVACALGYVGNLHDLRLILETPRGEFEVWVDESDE